MHPLLISSPYPLCDEQGQLHDGFAIPKCEFCESKCLDRVCRDYQHDRLDGIASYFTCPHQFSVAVADVETVTVRVNGVVETGTSEASPQFKKTYKSQKLKRPQFEAWIKRLHASWGDFGAALQREGNLAISALHDIKSLIGTILQTAEAWVLEAEGDSVDEKVKNGPAPLRTIYHSCNVLESLLQFTDIIANPESAKFGSPIQRCVYNLLHMLTKVYEAKADDSDVRISLRGSSYNKTPVLSSFIVVPVVLIDNALKHSDRKTEVVISVHDVDDGSVDVEFSSVGTFIPDVERQAVFQRGIRGSNARAKGSGLGLHVAQTVAQANGFEIHYRPTPRRGASNWGYNVFHFRVPAK